MRHWAWAYIGLGYAEAGLCWGFVRSLCRHRLGIEMPEIEPASKADQTGAIKRAAASHGWHRVSAQRPAADDIVVMDGPEGRHVGFAVEADGAVGVLHAMGRITKSGPVGEVVFDTWSELEGRGFHSFELWRRSP